MSGRVVAAFCFGAFSYHVVQSVAFAPLEDHNALIRGLETVMVEQKNSSAKPSGGVASELGTSLISSKNYTSTSGVRASKNEEVQEPSNRERSLVDLSEHSGVFRSTTHVSTSHIGVVSLVETVDSVPLIITHLNPSAIAFPAHIGPTIADIDKNPGKDTKILHIGHRLDANNEHPR